METVAQLIRKTVDARHLNISEAAHQLAITRPSLSKVLNGRAELSIPLARRIEKKFGLMARDLLIQQLDEQLAADKRRK